jgi:hypothetical protein
MSADTRYHSVLKGKVVGAKGPAKLTITKTFQTPLSPGNPVGKKAVKESIEWSMTTSKNGSFVWHVTPSDRPYEKRSERYTLTISSKGGSEKMQVHLDRGRAKNLGDIKV